MRFPKSDVERLWPRCFKCEKPVDRMIRYDDPTTLEMVLVAECHGEREKMRLPDEVFIKNVSLDHIRGGVAFAPKLPPPERPMLTGRA